MYAAATRPVTRGCTGKARPQWGIFCPLEECVGHTLKLLDVLLKNWAPLKELFAPLVFQAGYGLGCDFFRTMFFARGISCFKSFSLI